MSRNEGTDGMLGSSHLSVASDDMVHRSHGEYTSESSKCQVKGKEFDMETDLVRGGCGHSAKELEDSALICTVAFILAIIAVIVSAIFAA